MPRGDGTGPLGNGPLVRGRGGCQGFGFSNNIGRGMRSCFRSFTQTPETLEERAIRLEEQAAILRNLARQNRKVD